jgi:hypothetical protein
VKIMGEKYTLGDIRSYYRDRIFAEARKILSSASLVKSFIEVAGKFPEIRYGFMFGDFADHGGLGHIEGYEKFKRDLDRVEDKEANEIAIGKRTFSVPRSLTRKAIFNQDQIDQIKEEIDNHFQTRYGKRVAYADLDIYIVVDEGIEKESFRAELLGVLPAHKTVPFDIRDDCVSTEKEFYNSVSKQYGVVINFPGEGKKGNIKVECSGAKIIITTDPPIDPYIKKLETIKKENAYDLQPRFGLLKFGPRFSLSKPLYDVLENSRGIIIYQNAPSEWVQKPFDEYREETGQPKGLETYTNNFETYLNLVRENFGTRLEKEIQEAAKSLEELKELSKL